MKKSKVKRIKAWACLAYGESTLQPVGNGMQFQYPIFYTRKEADEFAQEIHGVRDIVRVTITYQP